MKILITSTSFQDTLGKHHDYLKKMNWEVDFLRGPLSSKKLIPIIGRYDGVICGDDNFNKNVLEAASFGLTKCISKYGVGLDRIDLKHARLNNIKIKNCAGINSNSVAEHVFALLLTFKKNIHFEYTKTRSGIWPRTLGSEINGYNFGILGLGNIGKKVSSLAKAFGSNVYYYDKTEENSFAKKNGLRKCNSINELFSKSDVISINLNLNEKNVHIVSEDVIKNYAKKNIIIINTARGKLVEESAIVYGLRKKIISGYLADVTEEEPINPKSKLLSFKNVIITSHIASKTIENVCMQAIMSIHNLNKLLSLYQ